MTENNEQTQSNILTAAHSEFELKLNSYAYFKLYDRAMSQDLVQDTFMKTWIYLVKGGKVQTMKAFLYHILNNLVVDQYRKIKNRTASLDTMLEMGYEPSESIEGPSRIFDVIGGKAALLLLDRLPEKYRKALKMSFVQGLSLTEMALITGQTKNAMAVQVHRGILKLKFLYDPSNTLEKGLA